MSNEKKVPVTEEDVYSTKGRWPVFIKLMAVAGIAAALGELVGTVKFPVGPGNVILLPMIFAMIFAVLITPDALGSKIEALKKICGEKEVKLSESMLTLVLIILGIKLGMSAGPNIEKVIAAGPALILQEFGNLGTMVIGLPIAMLLGMRREAVGSTLSICREPTLGLIGEIYGIDSPEGLGVMGTYMVGNLFGTIFFGLLGSFGLLTGIHPYALGMACGMGSGSMMTAASQALAASVAANPAYVGIATADEVLAFAATSNICTNVDGLYMEFLIALPVANFLYKKLAPVFFKDKA